MSFSEIIINWYSVNKRDLPWRNTKSPYKIWLSEIILQQTQVKQGLPYYEAFVEKYPTISHLAKATENDVLKLWQGLGYYSRARHLHTTAKYIAFELNGLFPDSYEALIKLKGVGDYTASAIASIAFDACCAVVDGNVYRVLARYFGMDVPINSSKGIKAFKKLASELINPKQPAIHNQAIMEFGALQCRPKKPNCFECPLNKSCVALQKKWVETLPKKIKKTSITTKYFNFLVCLDDKANVLFEKRTKKEIWQNLFQFPLIETKYSIGNDEFERLNVENTIGVNVADYYLFNTTDIIHKLSHQHLHTKFWIIKSKDFLSSGIPFVRINDFPLPILIADFLEQFDIDSISHS